jgi:hypothetical protein
MAFYSGMREEVAGTEALMPLNNQLCIEKLKMYRSLIHGLISPHSY